MEIGTRLPEILGTDQDGNVISLDSLKGQKFILYTYPKDNTSGCSAEACSLSEHYNELQALGYKVIGVSKDSAASHKKFIEKFSLPFPLIADTETILLQNIGAWGEKVFCGKKSIGTLRTTYLVNEEGIVEYIFTPKQIKTKIHAEQIIKHLSE